MSILESTEIKLISGGIQPKTFDTWLSGQLFSAQCRMASVWNELRGSASENPICGMMICKILKCGLDDWEIAKLFTPEHLQDEGVAYYDYSSGVYQFTDFRTEKTAFIQLSATVYRYYHKHESDIAHQLVVASLRSILNNLPMSDYDARCNFQTLLNHDFESLITAP